MSNSIANPTSSEIDYPDSDGLPIVDNTLQFDWIVKIYHGLDTIFRRRTDVFVAADLFWYPVEGRPDIRTAPEALVAFGRPKGDRGSYKQWLEGGIAPQVVFEVLSPGNRAGRIVQKLKFYERYGVGEFYIYDPHENETSGWLRDGNELSEIKQMDGWISPLLGIRFETSGDVLKIVGPDGWLFLPIWSCVNRLMKWNAEETSANRSNTSAGSSDHDSGSIETQFLLQILVGYCLSLFHLAACFRQ